MKTARKKTILKITLKIVVSFGFLVYLLFKLHPETLITELKKVKIGYFVIATISYLFTMYFSTIRWAYFIKIKKNFKELFELYMIGTFFNLFMPGTIGGDAIKAYYLYKGSLDSKKGDSLVSVFMERYMGFCGLIFISLLGLVSGYNYVANSFIVPLLVSIIIVFIVASIFVVYFPYEMLYSKLKGVRNAIGAYLKNYRIIFNTFLLSLVVQGIGIWVVYLLGLSIEVNATFSTYLIFVPIISLVSMVPISFSGVGVREYSFLYIFSVVGVSKEKAVSLSLLWFLVMIITGLFGMFFYINKKHH